MSMALRAGSMPPPVGGWDARSALADMPPQNAVVLDNWFPKADACETRRGFVVHSSGYPGAVETLMPYQPPSGAARLFAAAGGNI
jgi:hypothetical protein